MVFHWSLSDSKSPQVSRTLLSILAVLNSVVIWMVSPRPPTSKSSTPFSNPLVTVPNAPITIGIIVTCMFHSFFQFSSKVEVLIPLIYSLGFSHQLTLMVFHWSLSDCKSSQVSKTLLSILAVLNNVVVWMVSTRPPASKSSSPFSNPLVTIPKASVAIGIIVTFMFHSFFNSLARLRYLSFFSLSFSFILWSAGTAKSTILQIFVVDYYEVWSGLVFWPRFVYYYYYYYYYYTQIK